MSSVLLLLVVLFLSFGCVFLATGTRKNQRQTAILVLEDNVVDCDNRDYAFNVNKLFAYRNGSAMIMKGDVTCHRDLRNPLTIIIRIEKCTDKGNPDSCEYYTTWTWKDACALMNLLPFMVEFSKATDPPAACPLKKGHYAVNERLRPDILIHILGNGEDKNLWKIQFKAFEAKDEQPCVCLKFSVRVAKIRARS